MENIFSGNVRTEKFAFQLRNYLGIARFLQIFCVRMIIGGKLLLESKLKVKAILDGYRFWYFSLTIRSIQF